MVSSKCTQPIAGGRQCEGNEEAPQQGKPTPRTLVYDVETGSLRFSKPKVPSKRFPSSNLKGIADGGQDTLLQTTPHPKLLNRLHGEEGSAESSPTCVISNSAIRSNSSSPTMSSTSKTSNEMDMHSKCHEGRTRTKSSLTNCPRGGDEGVSFGTFLGSEIQKVGVCGSKKLDNKSPGIVGLKDALSYAKENGWGVALYDGGEGDQVAEAQSASFRHAVADKSEDLVKKKHGGIPLGIARPSPLQSASVMSGMPGIFSFNATYMSAAMESELYDYEQNGDNYTTSVAFDFNRTTTVGPLLKPTPSKWDDAEKWLAGSDVNPAKPAKTRSGPLLAHLVASQAGMAAMPRKLASHACRIGRHADAQSCTGVSPAPSECDANESNNMEAADVKSIDTPGRLVKQHQDVGVGHELLHASCTNSEEHHLDTLLNKYSLGELELRDDENPKDGRTSSSPPCVSGSFMKIAVRSTRKPALESMRTTDEDFAKEESAKEISSLALNTVSTRMAVSVRDMGTAMTPTASVDPSRTATPIRATTPEKSPTSSHSATPERNFKADVAVNSNHKQAAETPTTGNDHVQTKARQEILALGEHLGKAMITTRATKEDQKNTNASKDCTAVDLEELRKTVLTTRIAAWEGAEKAKYTSRFEREKAKIQAWENHEKAKAEAEMRRIEVKIERMRSTANEKFLKKLASARHRAAELRVAAEACQAEAAAKASKRAEVLKTTGSLPCLFPSLCT